MHNLNQFQLIVNKIVSGLKYTRPFVGLLFGKQTKIHSYVCKSDNHLKTKGSHINVIFKHKIFIHFSCVCFSLSLHRDYRHSSFWLPNLSDYMIHLCVRRTVRVAILFLFILIFIGNFHMDIQRRAPLILFRLNNLYTF